MILMFNRPWFTISAGVNGVVVDVVVGVVDVVVGVDEVAAHLIRHGEEVDLQPISQHFMSRGFANILSPQNLNTNLGPKFK